MFKVFSPAVIKQSALVIMSCMVAAPVNAAPAEDYFGHNTDGRTTTPHHLPSSPNMKHDADTPKIGAGSMAMMSDQSKPVVQWFEAYDKLREAARPDAREQRILSRPLNGELERVREMTQTCATIAKRYRAVARTLRNMPVQENWSSVKELREGQADFYDQEASVYEEMIKPRRASKTQEELTAILDALKNHASAAKDQGQQMLSMDADMRKLYGVHADRSTDDLAQYVMSTQKEGVFVHPK